MEIAPTRIVYSLGKDKHGRPIDLIGQNGAWTLYRHAGDQRDCNVEIVLDATQIRLMAQIVK